MSNALSEIPGIKSKKRPNWFQKIVNSYLYNQKDSILFIYIVKRILAVIPVMLVVALFVFILMHMGVSDPAAVIGGDLASPEDIARIRTHLGLDQPIYKQFFIWLLRLLQGDLGVSLFTNIPVTTMIAQRLPPTISLALISMTIAIVIAVPSGVLAAKHSGKWIDRIVMTFSVLGFSFPVFFTGYLLIYGIGINFSILPVGGFAKLSSGLGKFIRHLILPSFTLGFAYAALIARMTRASMIEVLREDYIRTANAKGVSQFKVLWIHALKNASVPITTVIGMGVAILISGVVVTESVFAIPGLGRMTADALINHDYPVIQGAVLLFSLIYVLINLLVDIIYTFLDPRIRY
jgi:peptide/nickel transport system permease protein